MATTQNVLAATESQMQPKPDVEGGFTTNQIFVGNINKETTGKDLYYLFSSYANVVSARVIVDKYGNNRGYGFVTFTTNEEAFTAYCKCQNITLRNRMLTVEPATTKQREPRSIVSTTDISDFM